MVDYSPKIIDKAQVPSKPDESKGRKLLHIFDEQEPNKALHFTFAITEGKEARNVVSTLRAVAHNYRRSYTVHQRTVKSETSIDVYLWREEK